MGLLAIAFTAGIQVMIVCLDITVQALILGFMIIEKSILYTIEEICQGSLSCLRKWGLDV